jgi:hypothetical protein
MSLEDDPLSVLGRPYAEVRDAAGGGEPRSVHEEPEEGEPDELYGEAPDGRWQCMLDEVGTVETIFLFGDKGCTFPFGLSAGMSRKQVANTLAQAPSASEPERTIPGLGWAGAYLRWDRPTYSLHAEFGRDGGLRQLTFMLPKRAPGIAP